MVDIEGKGADWVGKDVGIYKDDKVHGEFKMSHTQLDCLAGGWKCGSSSEGRWREPELWASSEQARRCGSGQNGGCSPSHPCSAYREVSLLVND